MRTSTWLVGLLALVGGAACADSHYLYEEMRVRTWPAQDIDRLQVSTESGSVVATGAHTSLITAEILRACRGSDFHDARHHINRIKIYDSVKNGELVLSAWMPNTLVRDYRTDFSLTLPPDRDVQLYTTNGDVGADGLTGDVTMGTTNGNVVGRALEGSVDGWSTNGNVEIDMARLDLSAFAALGTTNGNVTLWLPDDVDATFDLRTTNGNVEVVGFPWVRFTTEGEHHLSGMIGHGGAKVNLSSTNGNVKIVAR